MTHPIYVELDKNWLEEEYIIKKRSANEIAKKLKTSCGTVLKGLKNNFIPQRTMSEQRTLDRLKEGTWKGNDNPMKNFESKRRKVINRGSLAGKNNPNYGKKHSQETKEKIRQKRKGGKLSEEHKAKIKQNTPSGKESPHWQGGIAPYPAQWNGEIRDIVRERDKYVCRMCGMKQSVLNGCNKKLDVHHIDYDRNNLDPENLITLCRRCHSKTNYNRDDWMNFFQSLSN